MRSNHCEGSPVSVLRWQGFTANFYDAMPVWFPKYSRPNAGDVAIINNGDAFVSSSLSGINIQLIQTASRPYPSIIDFENVPFDGSNTLVVSNENPFASTAPAIGIVGTVLFDGTTSFYGSRVDLTFSTFSPGATLVNNGTMTFYTASPVTNSGGTIENNGTIALLNPTAVSQSASFGAGITGTGTIALGAHAQASFAGPVGAGQTMLFNDGASGQQSIQIGTPSAFKAVIRGFSQGDSISALNTPYTNATYTSTSANSGVLSLYSGSTVEGSIIFVGQYSLAGFGLADTVDASGTSTVQITTNVIDAQSGGLPAAFIGGGGGGPAMFRFFDTASGTHFLTSDALEAADVQRTRTDLVAEANGFGSVTQSDPNATAVYRFFDKIDGTHFLTASASESQTAQQTRPDLVYEPSSTSYEHAAQQAGDVPVYRFFDTKLGTHFYTGSQAEYQGIVTPGSSTYRADLTSEGVGFYAPAGSFFP